MKPLCFFVSLSGVLCLSTCPSAVAEFVCVSELSYRWQRADASSGSDSKAPGSAGEGAKEADAPAEGTPGAKESADSSSVVRFGRFERAGADEAAAKTQLEAEVNRMKVRASEACRRDHEAFGSCVATKFSTNSALLSSLGFSARKEVESALTNECKKQQGTCLGVTTSGPECREVVKVEPTPAAGDEKGKGEKGKAEKGKGKKN